MTQRGAISNTIGGPKGKNLTSGRKSIFGKKGKDLSSLENDRKDAADTSDRKTKIGSTIERKGTKKGKNVLASKRPSVTELGKTTSETKLSTRDDKTAVLELCRDLIEYKWYHGVMPRDEITGMLKKNGDYLVRKTTEKNRPIICLSVRHADDVRHFPMHFDGSTWYLKCIDKKKNTFPKPINLIQWLVNSSYALPPSNAVLIRAVPRPEYYILHDDITLVTKLGSGAFGEVWKGLLRRIMSGQTTEIDVAVKRMKGNPTKAITAEFVKEAKLMRKLKHVNIVTVHGVAPNEEPLMIIIELAANGCLKGYLKKNTTCPMDTLLQFATDAARGMSYLACQLIIHRDLAARNLLLGSNMEVKISDFGLSESGKKEVKINKMKLPIRWLAPETIDTGVFTNKTDVWSYSVTLWEIFTRCQSDPFPGLNNNQAKELITKTNPPMHPPPGTPFTILQIMVACFEKDPALRPLFPDILKRLRPEENVDVYFVDLEQHTQPHSSGSASSLSAVSALGTTNTANTARTFQTGQVLPNSAVQPGGKKTPSLPNKHPTFRKLSKRPSVSGSDQSKNSSVSSLSQQAQQKKEESARAIRKQPSSNDPSYLKGGPMALGTKPDGKKPPVKK